MRIVNEGAGAMPELIEPVRTILPPVNPVDPLPPALLPSRGTLTGRYADVEPLDARMHGEAIYQDSHTGEHSGAIWSYLPYGPFASVDAFTAWLRTCSATADPLFFAISASKPAAPVGWPAT